MTHIEPYSQQAPNRHVGEDGVDLASFLAKLTELSLECGIGISDAPTLYVLESEDRDYSYQTDKDGRLVLR